MQIGTTSDGFGEDNARIRFDADARDSGRQVVEPAAEAAAGHLGDGRRGRGAGQIGVDEVGTLVIGDDRNTLAGRLEPARHRDHRRRLTGSQESAEQGNAQHEATSNGPPA